MRAVIFGVIHPIRKGWLFEEPLEMTVNDRQWTIVIRQSQYHVFIDGGEITDWATFINQVSSIVQGCVDALGFHLATPLRIETQSAIVDGHRLMYKAENWAELLSEPVGVVTGDNLGPFVDAASQEPLIRMALADLRAALESPDDTAMLCFRAIESVRQWFIVGDRDENSPRKQSWETMYEKLGIDRDRVRSIQEFAIARRHGDLALLSEDDRRQALLIAREAVAALIRHRASSRAAAPLA